MKIYMIHFCSALMLLFSVNLFADVSVIVHPSNGSALASKDIAKIFLGKKKSFPSGGKVAPLNLKEGNSVREQFNKTVLGKSDNQIKSYWSKLIFTGKGAPPQEADSDAEIVGLVKANPNMIGYIDSSSVTPDVKVIFSF